MSPQMENHALKHQIVAAVVVAIGAVVVGTTYWQHHETRRTFESATFGSLHLPSGVGTASQPATAADSRSAHGGE